MIEPAAAGRRVGNPYTSIGVRRLKCWRCRKRRAVHQWQICADGNRWRPICERCDVALNALVLRFMRDPDAARKAKRYGERVAREMAAA
jgi:hypothetical protein